MNSIKALAVSRLHKLLVPAFEMYYSDYSFLYRISFYALWLSHLMELPTDRYDVYSVIVYFRKLISPQKSFPGYFLELTNLCGH